MTEERTSLRFGPRHPVAVIPAPGDGRHCHLVVCDDGSQWIFDQSKTPEERPWRELPPVPGSVRMNQINLEEGLRSIARGQK